VQLPGIEPATETALTCGHAEFDYVKTTRNDAKRPAETQEVLMELTAHDPMRHLDTSLIFGPDDPTLMEP
jgi:hypothetical protein